MSTRVKGHALVKMWAERDPVEGWNWWYAECECGQRFDDLPAKKAARHRHRQHKAEVLKSQSADGGTE